MYSTLYIISNQVNDGNYINTCINITKFIIISLFYWTNMYIMELYNICIN